MSVCPIVSGGLRWAEEGSSQKDRTRDGKAKGLGVGGEKAVENGGFARA